MRSLLFSLLAVVGAVGCGHSTSKPQPSIDSSGAGGAPVSEGGAAGADAGGDAEGGRVALAPFPPDQLSGTRLKARYWLTDDGSRHLEISTRLIWYDSELQTPCWFGGSDGSYTCEPLTWYAVAEGLFIDSACQDPTRVVRAEPPMLFVPGARVPQDWREWSCTSKKYSGANDDIVELGAPLAVTELYSMTAEGCAAVALREGTVVYPVARTVPRSELVTAQIERVDTGHRLSTLQLVTEDGARQRLGWYDNELGSDCTVEAAADGTLRCMPPAPETVAADLFGDAACKLPVVGESLKGPFVSAVQDPYACNPKRGGVPTLPPVKRVYRVGAPFSGDYYYKVGASCSKLGPASAGSYELAELLTELDAFEPLPAGSGRLQGQARMDAEGALDAYPFGPLPSNLYGSEFGEGLFDAELQQPCRFVPTNDGKWHCLPRWREQVSPFGCGPFVELSEETPFQCLAPSPELTAAWSGDECTGGYQVAAFGARIFDGGLGCNVSFGSSSTYYAIGEPTPLTMFQAATFVTE